LSVGIRCVKVGAYLTQELNFTNVSRLAGGIIAYDRKVNVEESKEESLFKGTNYVFDGRVGRAITDDKLGECITCGVKTNLISNCKNTNCHKRMVQCEKCRDAYLGTCSDACKQRVVNMEKSKSQGIAPFSSATVNDNYKEADVPNLSNVEDYAEYYSSSSAPLLDEIQKNTEHFFPTGAHMVSGSTQGQFLKTLASLTKEGKILEVGTFSGYATTCFWSGINEREEGGFVLSLERDIRAVELAGRHFKLMEDYSAGVESATEARKLRESDFDPFIGKPFFKNWLESVNHIHLTI